MPGKKCIGRYNRRDFTEQLSAKGLGFHGQLYSLFVSEPKLISCDLLFQNTIFFDEIVDNCLLMAVEPTRHRDHEKVKGLNVVCHRLQEYSKLLIDNNIIRRVRIFAPDGVESES
jgi:hypothetical protein